MTPLHGRFPGTLHQYYGCIQPAVIFFYQSMYADYEYFMFQNLVGSLERSRAAMAEDLANLSAQIDAISSLKQKLQVST